VRCFVDAVREQRLGLHSLMVVRDGNVVVEGWWHPYSADRPHIMFSVSKSFTSTAIGIAQHEGRLSIDEPILNFFPSHATDFARANTAGLTLRHVLSMATGHRVDTMELMRALPHHDWVKIFLESPIVYPPGERFLYNSGASFVLSAVIGARTGQSVRDYLQPRLFDPLGIGTPEWQTNARGINLGASGLRLRTEDVAAFGELYRRRGVWNGRRLLSEAWIDDASAVHVATDRSDGSDWDQGYGYQFWRSRHNSYRADGAYGQFALIIPDQRAVIAITAGTDRTKDILEAVWQYLLPAFSDESAISDRSAREPGAAARAETASLQLSELELAAPEFVAAESVADLDAAVTAFSAFELALPFNLLGVDRLRLQLSGDKAADTGGTLTLTAGDGRSELHVIGRSDWVRGSTRFWPHEEMTSVATATRGGWLSDGRYRITQQCLETPFARIWTLSHDRRAREVQIEVGLDYGFWQQNVERLTIPLAPS
jgi:CubicO group peptidase (beta-lactamase class C family)